ncbi:MAG: adenylate/guanylate cyclase domain-containing protein [Acidimicrobiia bacterium]
MSAAWEVDEPFGSQSPNGEPRRLRVYVSSSLGELRSEREAAKSAIRTLRLSPTGADLGDQPGVEDSGVEDADIFVGIYWELYGWVDEVSPVSDLEHDFDRGANLPRLIYVKEPAPDREQGLVRLLERIRAADGSTSRTFESPGELAELLVDDLAALMSERFAATGDDRGALPSGTLTFLFGDIVGSTRLVERLGDEYAEILYAYHEVIDRATRDHGGIVLDLEGERIFAVFQDAVEATAAAVQIHTDLVARSWPQSAEVLCRIGLHTGTARIGSGGYVGLDVHRASRVASSAHGGQIVVSASVRELVEDSRAETGWQVKELGSFALKGLSRAEKLFQVTAPGLEYRFPPPRARSTTRVRLPAPQNRLVGRERELTEMVEILSRPQVRLATFTGPGGIGKTRLAVAVAEELAPSFPDGVYFVNLATITDGDQVLLAVGEAAGIPIEGEAIDALSSEFQDQQVLLVVDNFEHVIDAGSDIGALLGRSPGLKVLATSRVALRITSEHEYVLEPLGLPPSGPEQVDSVSASDAVRLFIDRALAVIPGFSVDEDNASPVASIVRIVDGLPLAIELAAARLRMLTPKALSERLAKSLDALGAGAADLPSRQRTLDAAIDWSYQLLAREEQTLFARLCVFQGGFTIESAQEVAVEDGDAVDQLMVLVENSLVLPAQGVEGRLRMLAPIREFGLRRLIESGEHDRIRDRHAGFYVRRAEAALPDLRGVKQAAVVESLNADWSNIGVAADWLARKGDEASLVRLAHGLWVFIWVGNRLREGNSWLKGITSPESLDPVLAGRLWWLRGGIHYEMGEYKMAREAIDRALEILEINGDIDCHNWADFVSTLIMPAFGQDPAEIWRRLELSLARFRGFGDRWGEGYALIALGIQAGANGDYAAAERFQMETRELGVALGNNAMIGLAEAQIGFTYVASGRFEEARLALRRSFDLFRSMNYREGVCYALEAAASLSFGEGRAEMGMIALGAAEEVRARIGLHPWPLIMWVFDMLTNMADSVDDLALQSARRTGRQMNPFDAAALVLDSVPIPA